jgi:hypothetical protein
VGWRGAAGTVAVDGGEAGSVVADDGALALHHGGVGGRGEKGLSTTGEGRG